MHLGVHPDIHLGVHLGAHLGVTPGTHGSYQEDSKRHPRQKGRINRCGEMIARGRWKMARKKHRNPTPKQNKKAMKRWYLVKPHVRESVQLVPDSMSLSVGLFQLNERGDSLKKLHEEEVTSGR